MCRRTEAVLKKVKIMMVAAGVVAELRFSYYFLR